MNFKHCDRHQMYLMPPSMEEWLPEGHIVKFIVELVEGMDLSVFNEAYNASGKGGKAYPPPILIAILLYAYCCGERSSRMIERLCLENVGFRYLAGNQAIDHCTINRFRSRHEEHLKPLFEEILRQCAAFKIVKVGVLALDGTKIKANASLSANRTEDGLAKDIEKMFNEAKVKDKEEDAKYGEQGKEESLPKEYQNKEARLAKLKELKAQLAQEKAAIREEQARKITARETAEAESGQKKRGRKPTAPDELELKEPKVNLTDEDSKIMKTQKGFVQGYNGQIVVTGEQIIVAAELTQEANDQKQLVPMLAATEANLKAVGIEESMGQTLVDAGYPNEKALAEAEARGWDILGATQKEWKQRQAQREGQSPSGPLPEQASRVQRMAHKMLTPEGRANYKLRGQTVEPVFGQIKHNQRHDRFSRRGFSACQSEWYLICGVHNLKKLWRAWKNN